MKPPSLGVQWPAPVQSRRVPRYSVSTRACTHVALNGVGQLLNVRRVV
jgi:hypothetical protein